MQTQILSGLNVVSLGVVPYQEALQLQVQYHSQVLSGELAACLMLLEHRPVLTLGKHAKIDNILAREDFLRLRGVEICQSDRGGEVTAHMPGQLVIYPILPLQQMKTSPKAYVDKLLNCIILTLQEWGIEGHADAQYPGVWVGEQKICAVGVRFKERVTLHGLALNVENNLQLFEEIIPCGIVGRGVCSIETLLQNRPHPSRIDVEKVFLRQFMSVFGVPDL